MEVSFQCYYCHRDTWRQHGRDRSYWFDLKYVESLHGSLMSPLLELSDLIELVSAYSQACAHIKRTISDIHQVYCHKCTECGQHILVNVQDPKPCDIPDENKDEVWMEALCYYLGLDEHQAQGLQRISKCVPEMIAIRDMIGMTEIKVKFVELMKYLSTSVHGKYMMHIMIAGPPGHGKTEIGKLLGQAFKKSGLLKSDKFVIARRADLIGQYCGQTAPATTKMFDSAKGGVIMIDEVQSLGNTEKSDVFTGECIDTINQILSERTDTLCIIAGYEEEIQARFFSYNEGLERRFPWKFIIKKYTPAELIAIFVKLAREDGWEVAPDAMIPRDISDNDAYFPNAGGDIANLVNKCIIAHASNAFLGPTSKILTRADILKGLAEHKAHRRTKRDLEPPPGMYI